MAAALDSMMVGKRNAETPSKTLLMPRGTKVIFITRMRTLGVIKGAGMPSEEAHVSTASCKRARCNFVLALAISSHTGGRFACNSTAAILQRQWSWLSDQTSVMSLDFCTKALLKYCCIDVGSLRWKPTLRCCGGRAGVAGTGALQAREGRVDSKTIFQWDARAESRAMAGTCSTSSREAEMHAAASHFQI
eukprot:5180423-Ditylum_brightwellii.AAC.1